MVKCPTFVSTRGRNAPSCQIMKFYIGTYNVKVDNKGRLRLPSKLLEQIGDGGTQLTLYIARGVGKCLALFTEDEWERTTNKHEKLDLNVVSNLIMVRTFHRCASKVEPDSADRISLNPMQLQTAEIDDEVVIHTYMNRIEIWAKDKFMNNENLLADDFGLIQQAALTKTKTDE